MHQYENIQNSEEEINLPEENILESKINNNNNYSSFYHTVKTNQRMDLNNNNDSYLNRTSPRENNSYIYNENYKIPHHHHHIYHIHHHYHSPCCTHSTSRSRSCSPSPINNISQPLISPNLNITNESANRSKLIYTNENNISSNNFNYDDIKKNNHNNNIFIKRFQENETDNNSFINNNDQINRFNALVFDEEMSKLARNKYNKLKQYNESYYFKKQFGEDLNINKFTNLTDVDNNLDEFKIMRKKLEEKYKIYNLITKYDEVNFNKDSELTNKENYNENITKENIKETNEEINNKKRINKFNENNIEEKNNYIHKKENRYNKKYKYEKNNEEKEEEISIKNKKANKDNKKMIYNSSQTDSSPEKNNNFISDENNKNKIQRAINEKIGQDNNNYIFPSYNNYKKNSSENKYNNSINNEENKNNINLLDYLKKENEELKKLNNSYKQILDTLFYFLNNISHKYPNDNKEPKNDKENSDLFDMSKDLNNIEELSKKLINLEFLINEGKGKDKNNINNNKDDNDNINKRKNKSYPLLTKTKEFSIQLPEPSKLLKFNDLIEGMDEKCFSFKNDNFIEKYKKNDKDDDDKNKYFINTDTHYKKIYKDDDKNKYLINTDINKQNKDLDNELMDKINNEGDRCFACLLGCNVSKRGYSPMRYNPYNKNELRVDDCGDLLERFNMLKENSNKDNENKNKKERISSDKIPKSRDSSKNNNLSNSKRNSKSAKPKKKIWK